LAKEGFLVVVISNLSDAPSQIVQEFNIVTASLLVAPMVSAAIAMNEYACVNGAYLAVSLTAAASAAAPDV